MGPSLGVSDFFAIGPLGEGMAIVRGLGAMEPGFRSIFGSNDGVILADVTGVAEPDFMAVSMRAT
jgi:hypothetical protein